MGMPHDSVADDFDARNAPKLYHQMYEYTLSACRVVRKIANVNIISRRTHYGMLRSLEDCRPTNPASPIGLFGSTSFASLLPTRYWQYRHWARTDS